MYRDEVMGMYNKIMSIKKPIPFKIPYYFLRCAEIIEKQEKEIEKLRAFKKQIENTQRLRRR